MKKIVWIYVMLIVQLLHAIIMMILGLLLPILLLLLPKKQFNDIIKVFHRGIPTLIDKS